MEEKNFGMESIGGRSNNTIRIASSSVKVFVGEDDDDDDSTKTPLLLERRRNTRGKGGYHYYVFVALATTTMMMVAFVAVSSFTSSSSKRAVLRLGTTTTAIKEHHRRRDSIGNTNNDEHHQHRFATTTTTTKRTTKAFKKTAAKAAFLRKGKKEDQRDDDQQQQQATCPQTYVRITDTSVKGHDLEEEEDGKMTTTTTTTTFSKRYDYRESTRECEDVCNENPTCVGFVDDATERYCAFKDAVEGDDMEDDVGRDSYKKLEVTSYYVPHFNKWVAARESEDENAEREKFVYEESAEECEEICTESTTCEAYVDYKDAKTPYCRFKTKDYVQSVLSTPAKDLYSKKTCVPGQPVGKEVLDEFEEKPAKEESDEEKKSELIDAKPNVVYIKVPKTGSTTMANIVRRMSSRHGIKNVADSDEHSWISEEPGAWWSHSKYSVMKSKIDALHDPYYSFSLLRDPVRRAISHFQFFVMFCKCKCDNGWSDCPTENDFPTTRDGIEDLLMKYLQRGSENFRNSYQLMYTTTTGNEDVSFETAEHNNMIDLRFVGVLEKFTESVLVLKEMLGLSLADVLYIPAKSGKYDWGNAKDISDGTLAKVKALFHGAEDYKYIDAESEKLNRLKANIPDFQNKLNELENHLSQAFDACSKHDIYTGEQQECLDMYSVQSQLSTEALAMNLTSAPVNYAPLSEESRRKIFPAGAFDDKGEGAFELD